jgi:regulator of sigma E protease
MSWLFYLVAIPVFVLVVMIHELGHFATAKWSGIYVEEFALGFPPRLIGFKRGETIYSINLIPIGGYVRMRGENGEFGPTRDATATSDPRSFAAKPAGIRIIVLLAGVTMNVLLAIVLFTAAEAVGKVVDYQPKVGLVEQDSPAAHIGIQIGDKIISVDGQSVKHWSDFVSDVNAAAAKAPSSASTFPITLVLVHPGSAEPVTLTVIARAHPAQGQGHVGVGPDYKYAIVQRVPIWRTPVAGVQDVGNVITGTVGAIWQIITGKLAFSQAFTGPVGIVQVTGEAASTVPLAGPYFLLQLTAFLSTSLAFVNVLPFPALDGGRVLLVLIELVRRGKRLKPETEGLVNLVGFMLLIGLIVVITYNDIARIAGGH